MAKGKAESDMNLEENVASMICYIGTFVTGIIFFLLEKKNKTVRFHALQSILTFLPLIIITNILWWIGTPKWTYGGYYYGSFSPGIPALMWLSYGLWLLTGVLWIILVIKSYQGEKFKLPVIGDIAEKHA
jgi:uncharacterized membrane protein